MSKRAALAACVFGPALLASCTLYHGDPDAQPDPPGNPPPGPPPPPAANAPGDEYDPANHRLLVSDCPNKALLAVDLATGARSVVIDTWPWTEPDNAPCVLEHMVEPAGRRVFATVRRQYPEPAGGEEYCFAEELVVIDTETRAVTPIQSLYHRCGEGFGTSSGYLSLQLDAFQRRLLGLSYGCDPNFCDYFVDSHPFGGGESRTLYMPYIPACYPDDDSCSGDTWMDAIAMSFDPADPDHRVLLLAHRYLANEYRVNSLDLATGAISTVVDLPPVLGNLRLESIIDLSVDAEKQRVLLTAAARDESAQWYWVVIAVDLVTGEHSLIHDGSPTAGGLQLDCMPDAAFDSRERRLLLAEPIYDDCRNGVFAVDADTGTFTQVAGRID